MPIRATSIVFEGDKRVAMRGKMKSYLHLEGEEWRALMTGTLKSPLVPCCDLVDNLRDTISSIYILNINGSLAERFIYEYDLVMELHRMYSPSPLHKLAAFIREWLEFGFGDIYTGKETTL